MFLVFVFVHTCKFPLPFSHDYLLLGVLLEVSVTKYQIGTNLC